MLGPKRSVVPPGGFGSGSSSFCQPIQSFVESLRSAKKLFNNCLGFAMPVERFCQRFERMRGGPLKMKVENLAY